MPMRLARLVSLALLLGGVLLNGSPLAVSALSTFPPHAKLSVAATPPIGTVTVDHLNVRSGPGLVYRLLGHLAKGDRVPVLQTNGEWAMIYYNGGPNGYGWVNGAYLSNTGLQFTPETLQFTGAASLSSTVTITPTALADGSQLAPPEPINFDGVTFSWRWLRADELAARDWYFDLQLFAANRADPYEVLVVEPSKLVADKGVYRFSSSLELGCNSTWAVQIAVREEGHFARWVSSRSTQLPLGLNCAAVE